MGQAFVPGLEVTTKREITRIRELPVRGQILVKKGQIVTFDTIVARAELAGELHILRIAEKLGIEPFEVMRGVTGIGIKVGQKIPKGEILCEHAGIFGLFRSSFLAPVAGTVEFISEASGHIGLRETPRALELQAFIPGEIVEIMPERSVTIRTQAAFAQGIFGIGGERVGILHVLGIKSSELVTEVHIPDNAQGKVLVGGMAPTVGALKKLAECGAVGFITGSIEAEPLKQYLGYDLGVALTGDEAVRASIIVTEGFGKLSLSPQVSELLQRFHGKTVSINGATQVRAGAIRPEIIIPHDENLSDRHPRNTNRTLEAGVRIRLIRVPYFGLYATVTELPHDPCLIETGTHVRVLKAKLDDGRAVVVPRANVELAS
jgi:hypothetical protein